MRLMMRMMMMMMMMMIIVDIRKCELIRTE